jgi:glycosidase
MPHFSVYRILLGLVFIHFCSVAISQNGFRSADGWGMGWGTTDYWMGTGFGPSFGKTYQNSNGSDNRYFRLYTDWGNNLREHGPSGSSDIQVSINSKLTLQTWGGSKAYFLNVSNATDRYVFRTRFGDGINNTPELVVFKVEGEIRSVSLISQSPTATAVTASSPVDITANLSGPLSVGQGVYLRYTTNNWVSSVITPMTGSNTTYTAQIPSHVSGTTVKYYIFTSGAGLIIGHNDADFFTINGNTNNGNNYQYTVLAGSSAVSLNPSFPLDNQQVTITFDATGTDLAGAAKVYLHSGVSATQSNPTLFQYTIGNWGQDDGIGQMTNNGGNNWSITLASLRTYFNVPDDKDIFGLNMLFRNANGTLKEDLNGANYYFAVNPGNYFNITYPTVNHYFTPVGQNVNHTATANNAPLSWLLKEIDPVTNADIATLHTQMGSTSFSHNIVVTNTNLRKFRLTADFNGTLKSKTFLIQGYNPIGEAPRPFANPGIHYHEGDPTRATLVLHAPTFTTFKNGNGGTTGTNNTTPKTTVYVVGDFNNWTPTEAYKLYRDRDGWNGTVDADNDGDRGDYWWITLEGLTPGQEYVFQYLIDGSIRVADPYTHKVSDPDDWQIPASVYPNLITYRSQAVDRASVLQTNQQPYTWEAEPFTKPTDNNLNIYELHFRDFTEEGTYLKAIEKLDYIKGLGINAIHVMPVSEFEGNSSWGYNPNFYFAADKAYGTANDLKKFIDECHKRKIQVFNDLVLNHAFYSNVMAKMYWNSSQNKPANDNPWFNPDHRMVADPGGWWGADWNHESEHTQKMVDRALDYWLQEFKFDGYRFDFTKGFGQTAPDPGDPWASSYDQARIDLLERMFLGMKNRNPGSVVIFEHLAWATEDKVLADQGVLMWSGVGHHNDVKRMILGYNQDNTNIYESGVFNTTARNFQFANWMSYAESHDEERLGYEVSQFFNGTKTLENIVKRLKIALGFNLLLPGPRMIWQFQELGYDYSINFNGRTGEKPVRWDYYDNATRRELYHLTSKLLKVRNRHNIYNTTPDYGNIGLGAGNIHIPRVMRLSSGSGTSARHVIIVANLDPVSSRTANPGYDVTGTWYRYNGNPSFDGSTFTVNNVGDTYGLAPSEMVVFTNFPIDECTDVRNTNDSGDFSLRNAINCAPSNGTVTIEYPVYDQTITLNSPIEINKNITIIGFPSKKININGSTLSQPVFSIAAGHTVTINGVAITCSQGGNQGRCLVNEGILTLDHVDMLDNLGTASGSSLLNQGGGTLIIKGQNLVKKP